MTGQWIRIQFEVQLAIPDDHYSLVMNALVTTLGKLWVQQAARLAGRSRSEFSRYFTIDFGLSFRSACRQVRYYVATVLLTDTSMRVSEIATQLGYDSLATFERGFRSWHGMSPTRYRNQEQASQVLVFRTSGSHCRSSRSGSLSAN